MKLLKRNLSGSYQLRILLGSLFAIFVADGLITIFLIQNGFAHEGNPFMSYWVETDKFLTLKVLGGLLATIYLALIYNRSTRLSIGLASFALTAYAMIICWNLLILI